MKPSSENIQDIVEEMTSCFVYAKLAGDMANPVDSKIKLLCIEDVYCICNILSHIGCVSSATIIARKIFNYVGQGYIPYEMLRKFKDEQRSQCSILSSHYFDEGKLLLQNNFTKRSEIPVKAYHHVEGIGYYALLTHHRLAPAIFEFAFTFLRMGYIPEFYNPLRKSD